MATLSRRGIFRVTKNISSLPYRAPLSKFSTSTSIGPRFIQNALKYGKKTAIIDHHGTFTYQKLAKLSQEFASNLGPFTPNDATYVVSKWTTFLSGGIYVPLCKSHPPSELDYVIKDSKSKFIISTPEYSDMMEELSNENSANHFTISEDYMNQDISHEVVVHVKGQSSPHDDAMIIYTSGTTGRPKGVLWTHENLNKQINSMLTSWEWQYDDTILHVLPLHHVHGVVNALMCPLSIGGTVIMKNKFKPDEVWDHLLGEDTSVPPISVFMAVPTIYVKLLQYFDENLRETSEEVQRKCERIRLMVSGSASLPTSVFEKWKEVTSHDLLERYGMTEIGMALTNPYKGKRIPGAVGKPFPGVEVKIVEEESRELILTGKSEKVEILPGVENSSGELLVRGPIFKEYWGNPQATKKEFEDGWFKTGDTAVYKDDAFQIVGRTSVDIIKSGGYKMGALEIERYLLEHENISEVAIIGVPDETWGQCVGAIIVVRNESEKFDLKILKSWCNNRLPSYKVPTLLNIVKEIPKNAMGKVNKKQLLNLFNK